ncbi:TolC family protein [Tunturibacter empetritectus]|uniref:TolC family protein n=1 Tax=Tunturiibacter empetritectus TaxID=3069691 RepID=A0AAU7ZFY2_9BACT
MVTPAKAQQQQQLSGRPQGGASVSAQQSTAPGGSSSSVDVLNTTVQVQGSYIGSVPDTISGAVHLNLHDAIQRALKTNLGTVGASASQQQARGVRLASLSALLPSITGSISENVNRFDLQSEGLSASTFGGAGASFPTAVGPVHYYDAHAAVSEDLLDPAAVHNLRSARASENAALLNFKDARELVVYATAGTYLQLLATMAEVESERVQVDYAQASYKQAAAQNSVGTKSTVDTNKILIQLETEQQRLLSRQTDYEKQKMQLERIMGLPLGATVIIDETLPYTPQPPISLEDALQQAVANRADLQAAKAQLRAAEQTVKASKSEYLPTFALSGTYGIEGTNPNQGISVYTGVASLSIPIWQGGKAKADVVQANAAVAQRKAELADQQQVVELDVRNAYLDMETATKQVTVAIDNRKLALATLKQSQDRFAAGVTTSVEVVQAHETLASAEQDYISSLYSHNLAKVSLARAIGDAEHTIPDLLKGN